MSDLQCPAIVVMLTPDTVVDCHLPGRNLAGVIVTSSFSAESRALAEANRLASEHDCKLEAADIVDGAALVQQIAELADLYRGETVVVVATSRAVCDALEWEDAPSQPVAIAVDSDGRNVIQA